jgi:leader peptidase (prepilin peptidase)/N-methyltransferase
VNNGGPRTQLALSCTLLAMVAASLFAAPGMDGLLGGMLGAIMLAIAVTDARLYLIPNTLTGAAVALALFRAAAIGPDAGWDALLWAIGRALIIALPLFALMAGYRLGLGDVKLAAVAGAWLDLPALFAVIEFSALAAIGVYLLNAAIRRRPLKATAFLPFGLFLAPAIWLGWLAETLLG